MRFISPWRKALVFLLAMGAPGCASQSAATGASERGNDFGVSGTTSTGSGNVGTAPNDSNGAAAPVVVPPEMEVEKAFEAPVATDRYVWAANPKTGRVALIDSQTYQVKTVAAGAGPTFISAIPGAEDRAIVINVLSNDATLLAQTADGLDQKTFQIAERANAWAISPDAHWAIAWTDVSRVPNPDAIEGFQTISIIDLTKTDASSVALQRTVGFRPSSLSFAADPPRAFAVTQDGISVVDLSGNPAVQEIRLDPVETPSLEGGSTTSDAGNLDTGAPAPAPTAGAADVSIAPKGDYAVVRREGSAIVTIIDLTTFSRTSVTLSGPVTDLDLADTGDRAVAVVRDQSRVAVLPVPGAGAQNFDDILIEGETIGSVVIAPHGETAMLYTNAVAIPRLTVLDLLPTPTSHTILLHAPVLSVYPSPNATHAVVLHNSWKGQAFQSPGAFSLVALSGDQSPVIRPTDAPPLSVAIAPAGDRALIAVRDDKTQIYGVYLAHMDSLAVDRFDLASPPTSAGFVGTGGLGFIAQDHPEGRITFIEPTGKVRTITGFELGASVVEWSPRDGGQ